jgi:thymidylate synthase
MRIYSSFKEMYGEVGRDLWEMGIRVHPQTMQDKVVKDDKNYETVELRAYCYQVSPPINIMEAATMVSEVGGNLKYCNQEFLDRINPEYENPGESWKLMDDVWNEFMHDGKFAYTYNERYQPQIYKLIEELKKNPETRQGVLTMYDYHLDQDSRGGKNRVPCSLMYQFMIRENALDCIYFMRSCDYLLHFPHDVYITALLQNHIATELELEAGYFTHFMSSLHAYEKDIRKKGIF